MSPVAIDDGALAADDEVQLDTLETDPYFAILCGVGKGWFYYVSSTSVANRVRPVADEFLVRKGC